MIYAIPQWLLPVFRLPGDDVPEVGFAPRRVRVGQVIFPSARMASIALGRNPAYVRCLIDRGKASYVD